MSGYEAERKKVIEEGPQEASAEALDTSAKSGRIADREDEYKLRRFRALSPKREDVSDPSSFAEAMRQRELEREHHELARQVAASHSRRADQMPGGTHASSPDGKSNYTPTLVAHVERSAPPARKRRWDMPTPDTSADESAKVLPAPARYASEWDAPDAGPSSAGSAVRGGQQQGASSTSETPVGRPRSRWDETPLVSQGGKAQADVATPLRTSKSRWDETPIHPTSSSAAPVEGSLPLPNPLAFFPTAIARNPEDALAARWEREFEARNRYMTEEEIDSLLPTEGYAILEAPPSYVPVTPSRKLLDATPGVGAVNGLAAAAGGFHMQNVTAASQHLFQAGMSLQPADSDLPPIKPEDYQYFSRLLTEPEGAQSAAGGEGESLDVEKAKERKVMKLLLRIKSGTPQMRRQSMRQITERARDFGPGVLFDQLLPLLMSPALEDQERHVLVKVVDRILSQLGPAVRPYVHKILVVIEPLLIDEDYYVRVEGREIICNVAKAAGLATMIATLRPDIDHADEYVRNTTARTFAVVASAMGIGALVPFLRAVCRSKKSWQARHTGVKIIQQIAILLGCAVLPHLKALVECIAPIINEGQEGDAGGSVMQPSSSSGEAFRIRIMAALAISSLAEASAPYGIESFEVVLASLWRGIRHTRGKSLAAHLKAVGFLIVLMDATQADYYIREVMPILIREFKAPDDEMKRIILKVVKQCTVTAGVDAAYLRSEVLPDFFCHFWVRRMALERRNARQLIETTLELAVRVGAAEIVTRIVPLLKDESEPFRRMAIEANSAILNKLGGSDLGGEEVEGLLVDGMLFAFQEQTTDDLGNVVMNGFSAVLKALDVRIKPYLLNISSIILWRLANRTSKVRQLAADLVGRVAQSMTLCHEEGILSKLSVVLYENLGEEYPDVLSTILGALKAIVSVIGMSRMTPPIKDLLPRLTPILRNRHERVQENTIELVGRIADRASEAVSAREWMRICFELLDMLKAHRKSIRRAAINAFGYIAKAIGPQDVLAALLNNLKVQERQNRVCTTLAIAIVAETCAPFTVLPALMNEYRVPEMNVQNGVLKSLAFMFEYIGEMSKDYIYAVTPLLDDALIDRDQVHRQTAAMALKHMALGVAGFGCEEALLHLLNSIIPNVFDANPHLITAVIESIDAMRLAVGPCAILQYVVAGLFHPARRVRDIYWKIYNNLYIGSQSALIPCYPRIQDEGDLVLRRHIMDIVI